MSALLPNGSFIKLIYFMDDYTVFQDRQQKGFEPKNKNWIGNKPGSLPKHGRLENKRSRVRILLVPMRPASTKMNR